MSDIIDKCPECSGMEFELNPDMQSCINCGWIRVRDKTEIKRIYGIIYIGSGTEGIAGIRTTGGSFPMLTGSPVVVKNVFLPTLKDTGADMSKHKLRIFEAVSTLDLVTDTGEEVDTE